jgi:hypothetical protein
MGPELGHISIHELIENGDDLYYTNPKTIGEVLG